MNEAPPATEWECPCGSEPPKSGTAIPVRTLILLREPACPFCGGRYRGEYRFTDNDAEPGRGGA